MKYEKEFNELKENGRVVVDCQGTEVTIVFGKISRNSDVDFDSTSGKVVLTIDNERTKSEQKEDFEGIMDHLPDILLGGENI